MIQMTDLQMIGISLLGLVLGMFIGYTVGRVKGFSDGLKFAEAVYAAKERHKRHEAKSVSGH